MKATVRTTTTITDGCDYTEYERSSFTEEVISDTNTPRKIADTIEDAIESVLTGNSPQIIVWNKTVEGFPALYERVLIYDNFESTVAAGYLVGDVTHQWNTDNGKHTNFERITLWAKLPIPKVD